MSGAEALFVCAERKVMWRKGGPEFQTQALAESNLSYM